MAMFNTTVSWQSATLTQDEIWQNRDNGHSVLTTVEVVSGDSDMRGIALAPGEVRIFRAGQTVRWRLVAETPLNVPVQIHRELHQ